MAGVLTEDAEAFLAGWRRLAIPSAALLTGLFVPLVNRLPPLEGGVATCAMLALPLAAIAVWPLSKAWVVLVCLFPSLDGRLGFAAAVVGCASTALALVLCLALLLIVPLSIFAAYPILVLHYAYPGVVLGLVVPRLLVGRLRPPRLRDACAIR